MSSLRIFSYLPNPRLAKATITARLCGVVLDIRGAAPEELSQWLWDYDAHPMSGEERDQLAHLVRPAKTGFTRPLYKTPQFLRAHPFGTVPAAFGPDGEPGIFESNSIMRAVARLGDGRVELYGEDPYRASRIDSFLDASLLFARDTQIYVLQLRAGQMSPELQTGTRRAFETYMGGIDRALERGARFIVGEGLTLADICFVTELVLFHNESVHAELLKTCGLGPILGDGARRDFPRAFEHYDRLCTHEAIAPDLQPYLRHFTSH